MVKKLLITTMLLALLFASHITVYAEQGWVPDEYLDLENTLPDDVTDKLPDGVFSDDADEFTNGVSELTSWKFIIDYAFDILGLNVDEAIRAFATILALLALCALLNMLRHSLDNTALGSALSLVSSAAIIATVVELSREPLERAMTLLEYVRTFINTISPTMTAMYAMGGNITSALVNNYGLIVFITILDNICISSLEFILGICMSLAISSSFIDGNNLSALSSAIKKGFTFFLGFIMLLFTTVISTQTLLASKADTITTKTAKLLAMQVIPVVGSTVGESLRTAGASIEYLRSNVGVALIVILILAILPTIITISIYRLVFIAGNAVSGLLGCNREGTLILEISSIFGYVLAILCISSIVVIYLLTIFAKCSSALV